MTATEMLTAGLNATLHRPVVNGRELRCKLIQQRIIKPAGRWEYVPSPNRREAKLVWTTTATS